MIKAILKDLIITGNPNIYGKLQFTETEDIGDDFYLSGTACIGTEDTDGEDNFDFGIITPKALAKELKKNPKVILGKHYFIVDKFDIEAITQIINEILSEYQAETWEELAAMLRPYFRWEYENTTYLTEQELFEMIRKEKNRE
ncbi:Imm8 family immunity protein [Brevibacillus brevis]|uniref:Imm8 family immunity protein n=1 Tax=Brevibacillus brevis TaxID=1393 RepID=UPI00165D65B8|nr:Imm8 family immunity protein [Brevibacillus brevis]